MFSVYCVQNQAHILSMAPVVPWFKQQCSPLMFTCTVCEVDPYSFEAKQLYRPGEYVVEASLRWGERTSPVGVDHQTRTGGVPASSVQLSSKVCV